MFRYIIRFCRKEKKKIEYNIHPDLQRIYDYQFYNYIRRKNK